jgi:hypothetical protein
MNADKGQRGASIRHVPCVLSAFICVHRRLNFFAPTGTGVRSSPSYFGAYGLKPVAYAAMSITVRNGGGDCFASLAMTTKAGPPHSGRSGRAGTRRLQGRGPPQRIVDHGPGGYFQLGQSSVDIAALRGLERDGLVTRTVFPTTLQRVEYQLTRRGSTFWEAVEPLGLWARALMTEILKSREQFDGKLLGSGEHLSSSPLPSRSARGSVNHRSHRPDLQRSAK